MLPPKQVFIGYQVKSKCLTIESGACLKRPGSQIVTLLVGQNEVWSWDITFLKTDIRGLFFKAYVFLDILSRSIVGARVFENETSEIAAQVFQELCATAVINPSGIILHSDNGSSMKGGTMLVLLYRLGVVPLFSRPNVSDDNA